MAHTNDAPLLELATLTDRERDRLRMLAWRYRMPADTSLRPWPDVVYDLRARHGLRLSVAQIQELAGQSAGDTEATLRDDAPEATA